MSLYIIYIILILLLIYRVKKHTSFFVKSYTVIKIKNFKNNSFIATLYPYIIRLSPESNHGYIRNWQLQNSGENVHVGYAFQWFAFAATLFVIYFVMNIKKKVKTNG